MAAGRGSYVVMDGRKLAELLRGEQGPVVRRLIQDGEAVKDEAKRLAPVSQPTPGERRKRRHGQLRDSIVKRVVTRGDSVSVLVGSEDPVTIHVVKGTRPHVIHGRPLLVFYWGKVGRVVAFPRVNHPGTKANDFLTAALRVLRRRY